MPRSRTSVLLLIGVGSAAAVAACGDGDEPHWARTEELCEAKPTQAFHERIEPLLSGDRVATCNQCHLSGVDLSAFARDTPCQTWACLLEQGLVDVESPKDSRILSWISRASPESELITQDVIQAEHDGFLEWIEANAACPDACADVECGSPKDGPRCDNGLQQEEEEVELPSEEDERGCSDRQLEQAFLDDVYAWRGRCYPCHFDTELYAEPDAPRWISLVGNCQTGAAATLRHVVERGLMDLDEPEASLLLLKPLDVAAGGVEHGGHDKFADTQDAAYRSFLRFIRHFAECKTAKL